VRTKPIVSLVFSLLLAGLARADGAQLPPDQLFKQVSPGVVTILTEDEDGARAGSGSGFFVDVVETPKRDPRALVATNYHVIQYAAGAVVIMEDETPLVVEDVVAESKDMDLAVLRCEFPEFSGYLLSSRTSTNWLNSITDIKVSTRPAPNPYPPKVLEMDCASPLPVGSKVYAIGAPKGLSNTLSEGIISGYREREAGRRWIQFSAPISPGSSGGPLLGADGSVIGVTTSFYSDAQNLNLAIPAADLQSLLQATVDPRPIAKGRSISHEVLSAFSLMIDEFFANRKAGEGSPPKPLGEEFPRYIEEREASGDGLALLARGQREYANSRYDQAVRTLRLAQEKLPEDLRYLAYYELGETLRMKAYTGAGDTAVERAVRAFEKASELNPDYAPAWERLSELHLENDRYPEALVAGEFLVKLVPYSHQSYLARGRAYAGLHRREPTERDLAMALTISPSNVSTCREVARGLADLGDNEEAIRMFTMAIDINPRRWDTHHNFGIMLMKMGRRKEAIVQFERSKELGGHAESADEMIRRCRR